MNLANFSENRIVRFAGQHSPEGWVGSEADVKLRQVQGKINNVAYNLKDRILCTGNGKLPTLQQKLEELKVKRMEVRQNTKKDFFDEIDELSKEVAELDKEGCVVKDREKYLPKPKDEDSAEGDGGDGGGAAPEIPSVEPEIEEHSIEKLRGIDNALRAIGKDFGMDFYLAELRGVENASDEAVKNVLKFFTPKKLEIIRSTFAELKEKNPQLPKLAVKKGLNNVAFYMSGNVGEGETYLDMAYMGTAFNVSLNKDFSRETLYKLVKDKILFKGAQDVVNDAVHNGSPAFALIETTEMEVDYDQVMKKWGPAYKAAISQLGKSKHPSQGWDVYQLFRHEGAKILLTFGQEHYMKVAPKYAERKDVLVIDVARKSWDKILAEIINKGQEIQKNSELKVKIRDPKADLTKEDYREGTADYLWRLSMVRATHTDDLQRQDFDMILGYPHATDLRKGSEGERESDRLLIRMLLDQNPGMSDPVKTDFLIYMAHSYLDPASADFKPDYAESFAVRAIGNLTKPDDDHEEYPNYTMKLAYAQYLNANALIGKKEEELAFVMYEKALSGLYTNEKYGDKRGGKFTIYTDTFDMILAEYLRFLAASKNPANVQKAMEKAKEHGVDPVSVPGLKTNLYKAKSEQDRLIELLEFFGGEQNLNALAKKYPEIFKAMQKGETSPYDKWPENPEKTRIYWMMDVIDALGWDEDGVKARKELILKTYREAMKETSIYGWVKPGLTTRLRKAFAWTVVQEFYNDSSRIRGKERGQRLEFIDVSTKVPNIGGVVEVDDYVHIEPELGIVVEKYIDTGKNERGKYYTIEYAPDGGAFIKKTEKEGEKLYLLKGKSGLLYRQLTGDALASSEPNLSYSLGEIRNRMKPGVRFIEEKVLYKNRGMNAIGITYSNGSISVFFPGFNKEGKLGFYVTSDFNAYNASTYFYESVDAIVGRNDGIMQ